jgi:hypothetical protein
MGDDGESAPGAAEEADAGVGGEDDDGWKSAAGERSTVTARKVAAGSAAVEENLAGAAGEGAAGSAAAAENSAGCAAATGAAAGWDS